MGEEMERYGLEPGDNGFRDGLRFPFVEDKRLSFATRGLMAYVLSHPLRTFIPVESLASDKGTTASDISRMLSTMIYLGYAKKIDGGPQFASSFLIYSKPIRGR